MIHSFKAANFYSIGDEIGVDFTVNANASGKRSYVSDFDQERVSLVEAVIGPNASGKTNVLKVLPFMSWLIVDAFTEDPDNELPVRAFAKNHNRPTRMSATFSVGQRLFSYEFKLTKERILFEKLSERSETEQRITSKTLFSRAWDQDVEVYKVKDKAFGTADFNKLRKNCSVVATAFRNENALGVLIAQYWRDAVSTNVWEGGYRGYHHHTLDSMTNRTLVDFYDNPNFMEKLEEILCKYDIGFKAFKRHDAEERAPSFSIAHLYGKRNIEVPLTYESSGTKQLIVNLKYIVSALSVEGGVAIIDELDSNLHPEIVEDLISMFSDSEINVNNSQIIFTSHTLSILSSLDKYQIVLVEKDKKGETEAWRLDQIKGVRSDDNYYAKYIAGAYGAVPNIG